jgi:hypothetical protein
MDYIIIYCNKLLQEGRKTELLNKNLIYTQQDFAYF